MLSQRVGCAKPPPTLPESDSHLEFFDMAEPRSRARRASPAATAAMLGDKVSMIDALSKSQAMIEFQMDGIILHANDNFLRTMGYTIDEVKGRHHSMFV